MECASCGQQREIEKGREKDKGFSDSKRANVRRSLHPTIRRVTGAAVREEVMGH